MRDQLSACSLSVLALCLLPMSGWAYRPFESTDADVVDAGEIEIELGYFALEHAHGDNGFITPQLVFNYGLTDSLEFIAEFEVEHPPNEETELVDPALLVKAILKEGVLQDKQGISFAVEAALLLPTADSEEDRVGYEAIGIFSGQVNRFTYHVNLGGGVDRVDHRTFGVWGVILELPVSSELVLVGELNGESVPDGRAENSGLLGLIWEPSSVPNIALDVGIRRGISSEAPDWGVTLGLSVSF